MIIKVKNIVHKIKAFRISNDFQFALTNGTKLDIYFLAKSGSEPASQLRDRSQNVSNRSTINETETISEESISSEETQIEETENIETVEITEEFEEEPKELEPQITSKSKRSVIKKILRDPKTYFIAGLAIFIMFIIGLIISLFPKKFPPIKPRLMCGGPSVLDVSYVVTTDESGQPKKIWKYYDYIASIVYREMLTPEEEENIIPYQSFSIVASSYLLGEHYNDNSIKNNIRKYTNDWCPIDKGGQFFLENEYDLDCVAIDEENSLLFVVEENEQKLCSVKEGCLGWANKGYYEDFGIGDGDCLIEFQEDENHLEPTVKSKYCEIKSEKFPQEGYDIIHEDGVNKVLVQIDPELRMVKNSEEALGRLVMAVDDSRGVLMTDRSGNPQKTVYRTKKELDSPACHGNVRSSSQPVTNELCLGDKNSKDKSTLTLFNQAEERGWPVNRILPFWYEYYFASWSISGQKACEIYKPNPKPGATMPNYRKELRMVNKPTHNEEIHYVKNYSDRLLGVLARADKITIEEAKNKFNAYIRDGVLEYGLGTGPGVAKAGAALINYLEQYGYKLPYSFGGSNKSGDVVNGTYYWKINYHGVVPSWGVPVVNTAPSAKHLPYDQYIPKGLDCVGFSSWVLLNGGLEYIVTHATMYHNSDLSSKFSESNGRSNVPALGDILYRPSNGETVHARIVVGIIFDYNNVLVGYTIAHAVGTTSGVKTGERGVIMDGKLKRSPVYVKGTNAFEPDREGYAYSEDTPEELVYSILDMQQCYDQRGPHKNLCIKLNSEDYFKGVLFE